MKSSNRHLEVLRESGLKEIMHAAYLARMVIPAFNIAYLPMVKPIVSALEKLICFGIVEVSRPDIEKFGAQSLEAVKEEFEKYSDKAYTRLHEDHVPAVDEDGKRFDWRKMIQQALDLGFDSVMIDGSRLSLEENIVVTRAVTEMAHNKRIPVEAELGAVLGHEKEPLPPYEELFNSGKGFTDPEEARKFVVETGLDWLSVAVGNIHGAISGVAKNQKKVNARLNIRHLRRITEATNMPIVLHGGSGIKKASVLAGIRNGVTKINIGTSIRQKYESGLREKASITAAQDCVRKEIEHLIRDYFCIQGSASRILTTINETPVRG